MTAAPSRGAWAALARLSNGQSPTDAALHWRSQFALEPTRGFFGLHRIDQRDHALINVIANAAFECSDVKARPAGGDPCQRCYCFSLWTWWPVKRDHDASPWIRRERYRTLSHRQVPLWDGDGSSLPRLSPRHLVNTDHLSK